MQVHEALALLELEGSDARGLTDESLRRAYLRLALRTHPDKNPGDPAAAERFKALGAAHALLLETLAAGADVLREQERAAALLALLVRALRGEEVSAALEALGEYRPPAAFGVDLAVPFDSRVLRRGGSGGSEGSGPLPDVRQAFRAAFLEEGLTADGDPADGYALPPDHEIC